MSATPTHPAHPFGSLLRRHRQAAGLTQEELAERAGLSIEGISALERGVNRAPRKDTVELLAEALSLSATARAAFANAARTGAQPLTTPTAPADAASLPPLVGRTAELARLEHHLAGSGSPIWLLAGDPGIGKSRLLHEAARRAPILGWSVLEGGCHRRSGQEPYAPSSARWNAPSPAVLPPSVAPTYKAAPGWCACSPSSRSWSPRPRPPGRCRRSKSAA